MTPPSNSKDEHCGLDGKSEHVWRYGGNNTDANRKCSYCGKQQSMLGLWDDIEDWSY